MTKTHVQAGEMAGSLREGGRQMPVAKKAQNGSVTGLVWHIYKLYYVQDFSSEKDGLGKGGENKQRVLRGCLSELSLDQISVPL